jgi:hypothetical protein
MHLSIARYVVIAGMSVVFAGTSLADVFSGQDNGAPTTGPFPNSTAAQTSFVAAASLLSPLGLITFENQPTGFNTSFTAAPGVTVNLNVTNFGDGFSGISDTTFGNLDGFNITAGGSKWLGFPGGSATFNFADPTDYFGFWDTGVQTVFTSSLTVTFNDGTSETLNVPINSSGGAAFYGFTDPGKSISAITITDVSNDAWGIDNVMYNTPAQTPEPTSILLLFTVVAGLVGAFKQRLRQA